MGGDRRRQRDRSGDDSDDDGRRKHSSSKSNDLPVTERKQSLILPSMIKNKEKRSEIHSKLKHQKKVDKKKKIKARDAAEKRAVELGEEVAFLLVVVWFIFHRLVLNDCKTALTETYS